MIVSPQNKVLIQGIFEPSGMTYAPLMHAYGTQVVAGVSAGWGDSNLKGIPTFNLVDEAIAAVGAIDTTIIFVPPYSVLDAALEAIVAGIRQIVIVTEGVPPLDMVRLLREAEATETMVVGPNSPGIIIPNEILLGTHPASFYTPGSIGIISRNGTLTYEVAMQLSAAGLGQSISVCIGSDAVIGSSFPQWLQILEEDDRTEAIVLVGEIGGDSEETAAHYIAEAIDKPVIAYIAGLNVPRGRRIGHAGAIIDSYILELGPDIGTADSKINAFRRAKIPVADRPSQVPELVKKKLRQPARKA